MHQGSKSIVTTNEEAEPLVICPKCRGPLIGSQLTQMTTVRCGTCGADFPVRDGVLDLLDAPPAGRSVAQAVMESDTIVRIYESRLWRRSLPATLALGISFEREQRLITEAAQLRPGDSVLDLACGPGIYTRPFAQQVTPSPVVGLDLSFPMLRYASRRANALGLRNVVWIRGTALQLPFPDARFALVNCCGALHLFPDAPRVLAEVRRVLAPGGCFTTAAFARPRGQLSARVNAVRQRLTGLNAFRPEELTSQLTAAGFGNIEVHHHSFRWLIMSARTPDPQSKDGETRFPSPSGSSGSR